MALAVHLMKAACLWKPTAALLHAMKLKSPSASERLSIQQMTQTLPTVL